MADNKPIVQVVKEKVQSAVDVANQMTKDFLNATSLAPGVKTPPAEQTAAGARKKQGEGFYQADIGD